MVLMGTGMGALMRRTRRSSAQQTEEGNNKKSPDLADVIHENEVVLGEVDKKFEDPEKGDVVDDTCSTATPSLESQSELADDARSVLSGSSRPTTAGTKDAN